jgi:hypothetical protein
MLNCLNFVCAVGVAESVTVTVKVDVPDVVGTPLICPVAAFRVRPVGKAPTVTLQVYGVVPPLACSVAL